VNNESTSACERVVAPVGARFVGSENLTVIVSPTEKPTTTGSSSLAVRVVIIGPCFEPKSATNVGEVSVEINLS